MVRPQDFSAQRGSSPTLVLMRKGSKPWWPEGSGPEGRAQAIGHPVPQAMLWTVSRPVFLQKGPGPFQPREVSSPSSAGAPPGCFITSCQRQRTGGREHLRLPMNLAEMNRGWP